MPIHFRCQSCDRALSIATRKAGTLVACPKCGKMISVPAAAGVAVESAPARLEAMPLFERLDFEQLLKPAAKPEPPKPIPVPVQPAFQPQPVPVPVAIEDSGDQDVIEVDGMVISRSRMAIIGIVIAVLLAVSFAVGYFLAAATVAKK